MKGLIFAVALLAVVISAPMVHASAGGSPEALYWQQWHAWQAEQQQRDREFAQIEQSAFSRHYIGSPLGFLSTGSRAARPVVPPSMYCQVNCL
jgi:hypothetical protein